MIVSLPKTSAAGFDIKQEEREPIEVEGECVESFQYMGLL